MDPAPSILRGAFDDDRAGVFQGGELLWTTRSPIVQPIVMNAKSTESAAANRATIDSRARVDELVESGLCSHRATLRSARPRTAAISSGRRGNRDGCHDTGDLGGRPRQHRSERSRDGERNESTRNVITRALTRAPASSAPTPNEPYRLRPKHVPRRGCACGTK